MVALVFGLYFLLFGNIIFLLLLNLKAAVWQKNRTILFFTSLGSAPLLVGLIFYYLVYLFPRHSDSFYLSIIIALFLSLAVSGKKSFYSLINFYKQVWYKVCQTDYHSLKTILIGLFLFISLGFILSQSFFLPAIDDSAAYINQGKAIYYQKEDLQKLSYVQSDANNHFAYSSSIRPGLTAYFAATMLVDQQQLKTQSYYSYKLIPTYFYLLLLALFIYTIKQHGKIKNRLHLSIILFSFVFFWILTRMAMFDAKEIAIYFLTLLSLNVLHLITRDHNRDYSVELILGLLVGLNIFINVHGMMICLFLLMLLLFFSRKPIWHRVVLVLIVTIFALIFSGFDLWTMFRAIFYTGFRSNGIVDSVIKYFDHLFARIWPNHFADAPTVTPSHQFTNMDDVSKDVYNMGNLSDVYFKGKLQIFTNIGYYASRGWLVLITYFAFGKKIWLNSFHKLILAFSVIYFLIIIDPLNINKHQNAIVLSGSPNYSTLLVFLGLVVLGTYYIDIIDAVALVVKRFKNIFIGLNLVTIIGLIVSQNKLTDFVTDRLHIIIPILRSHDFYHQKIHLFITVLIFVLLISFLLIVINRFYRNSIQCLVVSSFVLSMIATFFLFEVGKVPLRQTLPLITQNNQEKLENSLIAASYFKAYYKAKTVLPKETTLLVDNPNVVAYNDHFKMYTYTPEHIESMYRLSASCPNTSTVIFEQDGVKLCQLN